MPSKKISQLTAAGPLVGTEPLPIVQGGVTVKTTVNDVASISGSPIFQPDVITYSGTTAGGIGIDMSDYSPIVFWSRQILAPNLVTIYGTIYMYGVVGNYGDPILNTISMPLLESVGTLTNENGGNNSSSIHISEWIRLQTINFSSLTTLELNGSVPSYSYSFYISNCPNLTTLNIGELQTVPYNFGISQCSSLTTFSIANLTSFDGDFDGTNNALTQVTIDAILNQLANVVVLANRTVDLSGGTNAAPSVTGATYVATLISNGCTVLTN
jgi:hypothetical protein